MMSKTAAMKFAPATPLISSNMVVDLTSTKTNDHSQRNLDICSPSHGHVN